LKGKYTAISRMIEEGRYCIDILHQVRAIKSALAKVGDATLNNHASTCVEAAISSNSAKEQRQKFDKLIDLFLKLKNRHHAIH
jgi:DNA-binding FrmR family transcriptional regulator